MKELTKKKIPLKDVKSLKVKQRWNGRGKKDRTLIDFLMKKKRSAIHEEKTKRRKYLVAKKELNEGAELRLNRRSRMAVDFRRLQKEVITKSFEEENEGQ